MFSLSTLFRKFFAREVIVPIFQSELSNPRNCKRVRGMEKPHIEVLRLIGNQNGIKASELDRLYNSGGRRANDLLHIGYVDNIGTKGVMKYAINDNGIQLLTK